MERIIPEPGHDLNYFSHSNRARVARIAARALG
jgi:hypothetical protein